jgi:hypothetical protein
MQTTQAGWSLSADGRQPALPPRIIPCDARLRERSHIGLRYRPLLDRPHRLARRAIENEDESLLGELGDRLDWTALHGDVY